MDLPVRPNHYWFLVSPFTSDVQRAQQHLSRCQEKQDKWRGLITDFIKHTQYKIVTVKYHLIHILTV